MQEGIIHLVHFGFFTYMHYDGLLLPDAAMIDYSQLNVYPLICSINNNYYYVKN